MKFDRFLITEFAKFKIFFDSSTEWNKVSYKTCQLLPVNVVI